MLIFLAAIGPIGHLYRIRTAQFFKVCCCTPFTVCIAVRRLIVYISTVIPCYLPAIKHANDGEQLLKTSPHKDLQMSSLGP